MRITVVSDTHSNMKIFQDVVDFSVEEQNVSFFMHLGDNYEDCDRVDLKGKYVVRVPGVFHHGYLDGSIDSYLHIPYAPFNFLLLHDQNDAQGLVLADSNVVLHGHTHAARCSISHRGRLYLNPGHLKAKRDRGYDASFMILTIESGLLVVEQFNLQFESLFDRRFRCIDGKVEELL